MLGFCSIETTEKKREKKRKEIGEEETDTRERARKRAEVGGGGKNKKCYEVRGDGNYLLAMRKKRLCWVNMTNHGGKKKNIL